MLCSEALRRISNRVGTLDDISGRALNNLFTNQFIIDELNSAMAEYARITKGIQDVYSFPLLTKTPFILAPSLALRSEAYYFISYISNGTIFGMDMRNAPEVYNTFRYSPMSGIANWLMPWGSGKTQYLSIFPMGNTTPNTTNLTIAIGSGDTTIGLNSTAGMVNNNGRVTIESEKILYGYKDATHLYNCVRGAENTTAVSHLISTAVTENNIFLYYSRLPNQLTINADDTKYRIRYSRRSYVWYYKNGCLQHAS